MDWRYAAEQFVNKLPDKVIVHRSECNSSMMTFDGVDMMGERLAEEVLAVVRNRSEVRKISFVAHSLGGLVARYAIGRLYERCPKSEPSGHNGNCLIEGHTNNLTQSLDKPHHGTIAGLEPMNFITFATPHLGSRGNKQLPFLCGLPFLERRASQTAHFIVGRSGKHLFLTDDDDGRPPLLLRMVNDSDDLKFISALRAFKRRVAYANANYDHMVGWRTSSIRRQDELPKSNLLGTNERYPHIVYVKQETFDDIHTKASSCAQDQKIDLEGTWALGQIVWLVLSSNIMIGSTRPDHEKESAVCASHLLLGSAVLLYLGFICNENDITHLSLNNTSKPESFTTTATTSTDGIHCNHYHKHATAAITTALASASCGGCDGTNHPRQLAPLAPPSPPLISAAGSTVATTFPLLPPLVMPCHHHNLSTYTLLSPHPPHNSPTTTITATFNTTTGTNSAAPTAATATTTSIPHP
ncbi:alpha/beta-Hydrolases superfamily protein [Prunus dulcis]|uniref:Alpha/beta-Hydrolases superfamily protein n=1 Tax=Prunus dulcis TaxID=3755 RepID=A0A4Y1QM00_PRUDU|nr:alpha/beta-Hydrolases superfamily protein [Prunus dulcis]